MTDFLHQRITDPGICLICKSPHSCPGSIPGPYAALRCSSRIPLVLKHALRWFIKENLRVFGNISRLLGGTIQINSGDIGEGLAAIISGSPAGGIGGHGPGLDLEVGEVKTISEIGGKTDEKRRFNHQFGNNPTLTYENLIQKNPWFFYIQLYGLCKEHGKSSCKPCSDSVHKIGSIKLVAHKVSTRDISWQSLIQRWIRFVAVPGRQANNFQLNAETSDSRDELTNTLGNLIIPIYLDAEYSIDNDHLTIRENRTLDEVPEQCLLSENILLTSQELFDFCIIRGLQARRNHSLKQLLELLEENEVERSEYVGLDGFFRTILETYGLGWTGRIRGIGKPFSLGELGFFLSYGMAEFQQML